MRNTIFFSTKGFAKKIKRSFKYLVNDFRNYSNLNNLFLIKKETIESKEEVTINKKNNTILISKSKKNRNMSNLRNSVQLIGRLGKNPEVKQLESGRLVANVSIATNDIYKNAKGEKVIETQWHNLVAWGKNAENFQKILVKGDEVAIQGKLTHRSYEDKEGITRYVTEVVVNEFVKLTSRNQVAQVA